MNCRVCGASLPGEQSNCACGTLPLGPTVMSLFIPGQVLLDKYEIEAVIGQGGMATVLAARDLSLDRRVALKTLDAQFARDSDFVTRFYREARVMARLDHPHIIPVYAVEGKDDLHFIVMKYLAGTSLSSWVRSPQPIAWVIDVLQQITQALDYLHRGGFIHRDIKPGNIFIDQHDHVTLLDLGIARRASTDLTRPGLIVGTPGYMSPEQLLEPESIDHRVDLYALGIVVYQMLTGLFPFETDHTLGKRLNARPPDPRFHRPELSAGVANAVMSMMQPGRAARPASAGDFFAHFARAAAGATQHFLPLHVEGNDHTTRLDDEEQTADDRDAVRTVNDRRALVQALPTLNDEDSLDEVPPDTLAGTQAAARATPAPGPTVAARPLDSRQATAVVRRKSRRGPARPAPFSFGDEPNGVATEDLTAQSAQPPGHQPAATSRALISASSRRRWPAFVVLFLVVVGAAVFAWWRARSSGDSLPRVSEPVVAVELMAARPEPLVVAKEGPKPSSREDPKPELPLRSQTLPRKDRPAPQQAGLSARVKKLKTRLDKAADDGLSVDPYLMQLKKIRARLADPRLTNDEKDRLESALSRIEQSGDF